MNKQLVFSLTQTEEIALIGSSDGNFLCRKKDPAIAKIKNKTLKVIIIPQSIVISLNSFGMVEMKRYLIIIIIPKND